LIDLLLIFIVIFVAFFPSIVYMVLIRNTEKYEREPWRAVIGTFLRGAIFGVILAAIIEAILMHAFSESSSYLRGYEVIAKNYDKISLIFLAVIVAPFVEEFTKLMCVLGARREINELEDGFVYGASAGFGFAATENLLYEYSALATGGLIAWMVVSVMRSISSALLHGSATAMSGAGYSKKIMTGSGLGKGYLAAVAMHSTFNLLASIPLLIEMGDLSYLFVLLLAIAFAAIAFGYVRERIITLDRGYRMMQHT